MLSHEGRQFKLGDNYYVVRHGDQWAGRREGAERVPSEHSTQADAIERGREIAQQQHGELRIQGREQSCPKTVSR